MALLTTILLSSTWLGFTRDAPDSESLRIDHVIVGVADLDRGMDQFEQLTGVRAVIGGDSPGRGSRNAFRMLVTTKAQLRHNGVLKVERVETV